MKKLNLGSGPNSAKGWINYDWGLLPLLGKFKINSLLIKLGVLDKSYDWKWPKISLVNIKNELPDENESVDYIYCSHVLEHFERNEATAILKECKRILKEKGVIRIVLPDLTKIIEYYKDADTFNREYFGYDKDLYVGFIGKFKELFIRGHRWMYDKNSARDLLLQSGFNKITMCSFRKGEISDLDNLDLKMHKNLSLYYEAKK